MVTTSGTAGSRDPRGTDMQAGLIACSVNGTIGIVQSASCTLVRGRFAVRLFPNSVPGTVSSTERFLTRVEPGSSP